MSSIPTVVVVLVSVLLYSIIGIVAHALGNVRRWDLADEVEWPIMCAAWPVTLVIRTLYLIAIGVASGLCAVSDWVEQLLRREPKPSIPEAKVVTK